MRTQAALLLALLLMEALGAEPIAAQPFTLDAELVTWGCIPPAARGGGAVPFSGIYASASVPPDQVRAAFPAEWDGRPRIRVGCRPRPPGLVFRFAERVEVHGVWLVVPPPGLAFDPPEVVSPPAPVEVDSIRVNWSPIEGVESLGTLFDASCSFFIQVPQEVLVVAEVAVNVVATYAAPGDTVEVWGTDVGIPDVSRRGEAVTAPIAVGQATWGGIKTSFR